MNVRYRVELSQAERGELTAMLSKGKRAARKLKRAQILLASDAGRSDEEIARTVAVSDSTVSRTKRRFVEGNLERALSEDPRPGARPLDAGAVGRGDGQAHRPREAVGRDGAPALGRKRSQALARGDGCIPKVDGEYVARMEDVLDLYAEAPDPKWPMVCFDESPVQLIGEVRQPIPAEAGQLERYDYEYHRNGTVNLFVCVDVNRPWRKVKVTERRAAEDYARCMRELVDVHYPDAACIRVVQDNLSTHSAGSLYEAFPPAEARRILSRIEFHYTPKHASWLNMIEIEIGALRGQCLDRRIDNPNRLIGEIAAWENQRNDAGARIKWMFTTEKARAKMGRAYPVTPKES